MKAPTESPSSTPWRLRFVDGAMRGRTIALKPGANRIGAAGDCDILLPGSQVRAHHAELHAGEVALAIERVGDAPLRLNDADVDTGRRSLVAGDRLELGGFEIELDRLDGDAGFLEAPVEPLPSSAVHGAAAPQRKRVWALFASGFVASVSLLWWTLGPALARPSAASEHAAVTVQRLIADHHEVRLVHASDGSLRLEGFVESPLRLQELAQSLGLVKSEVAMRVQAVETLVEQARRFVAEPAVAVHYGGQGRLVLSGATDSEAVQQRIARLGEDLHPMARIDDRVRYRPKPADAGAESQALWTHWQELLPAPIVSITEGADGMRHIQLANGQRYYEGAVLKSGARLQRISADELVIAPQTVP